MNVFEGKPDARQAAADNVAPQDSLFRKRYRQLTAEEVALHDAIKDKADELAALFKRISPAIPDANRDRGANVQLAIRHLEDAVYRAVKGLTA